VFAGPNGSGKSTIINSVRDYQVEGHSIDFGIYVNADDIADALRRNKFAFGHYKVKVKPAEFKNTALQSGLVNEEFTAAQFRACFRCQQNRVWLLRKREDERLAQIIADFLRKKLLAEKKKFSFETVFSHKGKLDIMRQAEAAGYKVYLYFVSTESPEFNKARVALRKAKGGHDVPPAKIESRYYRSLNLLYDAAQLCYQAFFFDNTGTKPELFAHFKKHSGKKEWDDIERGKVPDWFIKYYSNRLVKINELL
jgi:predicted ABC-type ATPase